MLMTHTSILHLLTSFHHVCIHSLWHLPWDVSPPVYLVKRTKILFFPPKPFLLSLFSITINNAIVLIVTEAQAWIFFLSSGCCLELWTPWPCFCTCDLAPVLHFCFVPYNWSVSSQLPPFLGEKAIVGLFGECFQSLPLPFTPPLSYVDTLAWHWVTTTLNSVRWKERLSFCQLLWH